MASDEAADTVQPTRSAVSKSAARTAFRDSLYDSDGRGALSALERLVAEKPDRWISELLEVGVLDPTEPTFDDHAAKLDRILSELPADTAPPSAQRMELLDLIAGLRALARGFEALKRRIDLLRFWDASKLTRTWALAVWLQQQAATGADRMLELAVVDGVLDPMRARQAAVPTWNGSGSVSIDVAIETLTEDVERILRFQSHARPTESWGVLDQTLALIQNPDFRKLTAYAQLWRAYEHVWARVRFCGWRPARRGSEFTWLPANETAFLAAQTGKIREQRVAETLLVPLVHLLQPDGGDEYRRTLEALCATARMPEPGAPWTLDVERPLLRRLIRLHPQRALMEVHLKTHHLADVLQELPGATWQTLQDSVVAVHGIAEVVRHAFRAGRAGSGRTVRDAVVAVHRDRLTDVVSAVTGLGHDAAAEGVAALVFDARRRPLELWDQPLIPAGEDLLLLVPGLITVVNPARSIEHRLPVDAFKKRGRPFEEWIRDLLAKSGVAAQAGIALKKASDGKALQFDVMAWWDGHLLLFETKCIKSITTPQDENRGRRELDEAFDQLDRRRQLVRSDWREIRGRAARLALPEEPPADDHIHTVAVMNVLEFSTLTRGRSIATDEFCLERYFGAPEVVARQVGRVIGPAKVVGRIRPDGPPNPPGLLAYLRDPAQVRTIAEKLERRDHEIPLVDGSVMRIPAAVLTNSPEMSR